MSPPGLLDALGLSEPGAPRLVQIIGAGGKTTAMFTLARQLHARGRPVISTTTTHILAPRPDQSAALVLGEESSSLLEDLDAALRQHGHLTLASAQLPSGKLRGVEPALFETLLSRDPTLRLLSECDGAAGRSVKAHAAHEPVLSALPSLVILVMGLDALNAPLDAMTVHRPELLCRQLGLSSGQPLAPAVLARAVALALARTPPSATTALLLTKLNPARLEGARAIARSIPESARPGRIIAASLEGWEDLSRTGSGSVLH
jgi:probable selenium-dependent hydroxylase accessory protein YqeC